MTLRILRQGSQLSKVKDMFIFVVLILISDSDGLNRRGRSTRFEMVLARYL